MKIKHYDKETNRWVIDGASNASELELTNPGFLNEAGESVSIDNGFTKLDNRMTQLEKNLAWVYLNGAKGGGSGGGTAPGEEYTFEISTKQFYTSTTSINIPFMIKSGSLKKSFTVIATDTDTNRQLGTWKRYSLTKVSIDIENLQGTTNIELSAYDNTENYVVPIYITVIAGAIQLTLNSTPPKTAYIGSASTITTSFKLTNNTGNAANFYLVMNDNIIKQIDNITESSRDIVEHLSEYIFSDEEIPIAGTKYKFKSYATTVLDEQTLTSAIISFDITVADGNRLTIITEDISEDSSNPSEYTKGSQIGFGYLLSYAPTTYSTFNINYTIKSSAGVEVASGTISNVMKGVLQRFTYGTTGLDVTNEGEYLIITLSGYATDAPNNTDAQDSAEVYCRIIQGQSKVLYANNSKKTLIAAFNNTIGEGFPNNTTGTWTYKWPTTGDFAYTGGFMNSSLKDSGVSIDLYKVNGVTNGFIKDDIPYIKLSGESYGLIKEFKQLMPASDIVDLSVFVTGFNFSITYKADSNEDDVICSLGTYENDQLITGYEIRNNQVICRVGSQDESILDLPSNTLLTVDLNVSKEPGADIWYFTIYINGVCSSTIRVTSYDWKFDIPMTLGCRNASGVLSNYSNVKIYDIKVYTSDLTDVAEVQNYISATEQAQLVNGEVDSTLDNDLRSKNFFNQEGECIIWNYGSEDYLNGRSLYNTLVENMENVTPYPIVLVSETSASSNFEDYTQYIYDEGNKDVIMSAKFPVNIKYHDKLNTTGLDITTQNGATEGPSISLQGTSSLTYNSKGYELYMGDADENGNKLLFQPKDEWLPENEFTLKSDVMDSAHANNVVIGKTINNLMSGLFDALPPMTLGQDIVSQEIKNKMKYTSEGFPVLLFIKFASGNTKFMGIYNFNLGRYAYYNLGLKILTDYTKESQSGPTLVKEYTEDTTAYSEIYSMEINQNDSDAGAFQQDDLSIVKFMADHIYDSQNNADLSYTRLQRLYGQLAHMTQTKIPKKRRNTTNTGYENIDGEYYDIATSSTYYSFSELAKYMNWTNMCLYYLVALIFGMVDSLCKNMTLRSWGGLIWYLVFYDMDTAFKLNNAGQDTVYYYAHMHQYLNAAGDPTTIPVINKNVKDISGRSYACYWNRIFEIAENLPTVDATGIGSAKTLEDLYVLIRKSIIPDPAKFIEEQYISYTDNTGAIVFNYDYRIKYFEKKIIKNPDGTVTDSTDFSQLKFLHGNRSISVKDWFVKRIYFLDSIYIANRGDTNLSGITSPRINAWSNNKCFGGTGYFTSNVTTSSKMLITYSYAGGVTGSFWADEGGQEITLPVPNGQTVVSYYGNPFIVKFDKFKQYDWNVLTDINFPLLTELDLSGNYEFSSDLFAGGVYNAATGIGLKNIRVLNLSGITVSSTSYTLDVSQCDQLQELNISNSSITNVKLPTSAILKRFILSNTNITSLTIENQSFLELLDITDCNKLTSIKISNCESLYSITIPQNVKTIEIINCKSFNTLNVPFSSDGSVISPLTSVIINTCPGLKEVNFSGQNNPTLSINLVGAYNLNVLNLDSVKTTDIILPSKDIFTSLTDLIISSTEINYLNFNGEYTTEYLDLTSFPNLKNIKALNCSSLVNVKCAVNPENPIELQTSSFRGCTSLTNLEGYFCIQGEEVFRSCNMLTLNREEQDNEINEGQTSLIFDTNSVYHLFEDCNALTYADFKYVMLQLNDKIENMEAVFKNCGNISGAIWRDLLINCPNVTSIEEAFSNTQLSGIFYSTGDNEGILDYCPKLLNATRAFANTQLEWIDNNAFKNNNSLAVIDGMFQGCYQLKSAANTRADIIVEGYLESESFFTNLTNLLVPFPKNVFTGCNGIKMHINTDESGNTLLFHTKSNSLVIDVLDDSLYSGIYLEGEITSNVFGGVTNTLDNWNIPTIYSIHSPFAGTRGATIYLSKMSNIFTNIAPNLKQAIRVFSGLNCMDSNIPDDIFKGCTQLNSIEGIFANLNLGDGSTKYVFPPEGMFDDCTSLKSIKQLFYNEHNLKLSLVGEGFKNCKLEDVSEAFSNSGVYGAIPYRLFFMEKDGAISNTITDISNVFKGCWCLGYDITRKVNIGSLLSEQLQLYTTWDDHILENNGNPVYYSLDYSNFSKTTNYDKDERVTILNPDYIEDESQRPADYDEPQYIDNPDYNPGDIAYDVWYLDGSGYWPDAETEDETIVKERMTEKYFNDDEQQKLAVTTLPLYTTSETLLDDSDDYIGKAYQNYAFPTDYLRYCSSSCQFSQAFTDFTYEGNILKSNDTNNDSAVEKSGKWEGLKGRIPPIIFKSLVDTISLSSVFSKQRFSPYIGLYVKVDQGTSIFTRGIMYHKDLFKYNTKLQDISSIFENTFFPIGVDIPQDLFKYNVRLYNISRAFANCQFNQNKSALIDGEYPQIYFDNIFKYNTYIYNAQGLFAVNILGTEQPYGLRLIEKSLLSNCYQLQNISTMFYYNEQMVGEVPEFPSAQYTLISKYNDYLAGCNQGNITNVNNLEDRLKPTSWS